MFNVWMESSQRKDRFGVQNYRAWCRVEVVVDGQTIVEGMIDDVG